MAIIHLEQKHMKKLKKMSLIYIGKIIITVFIFFSYLDEVKLLFSTSRYERLDCCSVGNSTEANYRITLYSIQ